MKVIEVTPEILLQGSNLTGYILEEETGVQYSKEYLEEFVW